METSSISRIRDALATSIGVESTNIIDTVDGDLLLLTVTGVLPGRSAKYAAARRRKGILATKRSASEHGISALVVYAVTDALSALEDSLRSIATLTLGGPPAGLTLKIDSGSLATIEIVLDSTTAQTKERLLKSILPILRGQGLRLKEILIVSESREDISDVNLLKVLKKIAPCDAKAIAAALYAQGTTLKATTIHRRLDTLRQRGLITYLGDQEFALTLTGLEALASLGSRRSASDIERVLALGRRRW